MPWSSLEARMKHDAQRLFGVYLKYIQLSIHAVDYHLISHITSLEILLQKWHRQCHKIGEVGF